MKNFNLDNIFSYHKPVEDQAAKYEALRAAFKEYAKVLLGDDTGLYKKACNQITTLATKLCPESPHLEKSIAYIAKALKQRKENKKPENIILTVHIANMLANASIAIYE
jgi:Rad3-related DNA helicase